VLVFGIVRSTRSGYGLLDLAKGNAPAPQVFTAPTAAKLNASDVSVLAQLDEEYAKVAAAVLPSVVRINTKALVSTYQMFGPFRLPGGYGVDEGIGSGAIVSKEGHIVTNYHVIKGANKVEVTTSDRKTFPATVIESNPDRDIALIKIDSPNNNFPALTYADSDKVRVGQIVFAVGNPFGLTGTVTQGIISARDRFVSNQTNDYFQTDTVINPGSSGGPLVNIRGEIVGINVSIYQANKAVNAWQGVGFTIPGNEVKQIVQSILLTTARRPAAKNVGSLDLMTNTVQLSNGQIGAQILFVFPDSEGEHSGLRGGDIVMEYNGREVESAESLREAIEATPPNTPFTMKVARLNGFGTYELGVKIQGKMGTAQRAAR
jgi:S1-C subfamily serine protease